MKKSLFDADLSNKTVKKEPWTIHPDEIFRKNGLIPKEIHKTGTVVYTIKKVRPK